MDYLLAWLVIIGIFVQTSKCCEKSWVSYDRLRVCFKVVKSPNLEWADAKEFCIKENATLADMYDLSEQTFIKNNLLRGIRGHGVWIGMSDDEDEGEWRWVNNSRADINRLKWWPGNPNNGNVPDGFFDFFLGEDCVEMSLRSKYRGQLNDYECTEEMPFICKRKDTSTTTIASTTPSTSIATESDFSRGSGDEATVPIAITVSVLCLMALLVTAILLYLRRYRNRKSTSNNYEDAHFTTSANENIYTCLDSTNQSALNNNNACASFQDGTCDQNSIHEYHSVHFSTQGSLYETINCSNQKSDYLKPPPPRKI